MVYCMVPHAWYIVVPQHGTPCLCTFVWKDGETRGARGRWICQSEGESQSSCRCLSCLDIVTWFIVPQFSSYILKRLVLFENKALHYYCHKYLSLLLLQTVCFHVLEKFFLTLWPSFLALYFLLFASPFFFYFFLSSSIIFGFTFFFKKPFLSH